MFEFLSKTFGFGKETGGKPNFGKGRSAHSLDWDESRLLERGLAVIGETRSGRLHMQEIRERLEHVPKEAKGDLVDRVLANFALLVFDLPASERSHHARRFGLLDHSLEVAAKTAIRLSGPGFRASPDPLANHRERPLWTYAGMIAGLAHDLGKVRDVGVSIPEAGEVWDPAEEPLARFASRSALPGTGPALWRFRPGRGMYGHKEANLGLLPCFLTPAADRFLGGRHLGILEAYGKPPGGKGVLPGSSCAAEIVRVIAISDQESAAGEMAETREKGDTKSREPSLGETPAPHEREPDPAPLPELTAPIASEVPDEPRSVPIPPSQGEPPTSALLEDREEERDLDPAPRPAGNPVERGRRSDHELDPARLLETVRRMMMANIFSKNDSYADIFVRQDYLWLIWPKALKRIAWHLRLPFDREVESRMRQGFEGSPFVIPLGEKGILGRVQTWPWVRERTALRIRVSGFLPAADLARLTLSPHEVKLAPPRDRSRAGNGDVEWALFERSRGA